MVIVNVFSACSVAAVTPDSVVYANTAAFGGPINTFYMSNSSCTPYSLFEQSREGSQTQGLATLGNHKSSQPYCPSGYTQELSATTNDESPGNNIGMKNIVNEPFSLCANDDIAKKIVQDPEHFLSSEFNQLKSVAAAGLTRQTSSNILHLPTKKVIASLVPSCPTPIRKCPVTSIQNSLVSNFQALTLRSTRAPREVASHFGWPSGCSEPINLASKSKSQDTSLCLQGIGIGDSGAKIGQKIGLSTFPDNAIGSSRSEQERLLAKCSIGQREDFVLQDMDDDVWKNTGDPGANESQHLLRLCQPGTVVQLCILNYLLENLLIV